jgi:hypothetical protein
MSKNYLVLVALTFNLLAFSQNIREHLIESGQAYDVSKVHSADLEGDGDLDVFTVQNLNNIDWYENLGNGNFSFQRIISSDAMGARDVNTGDFDLDGDLDVVSASIDDNKIAWYENLGNGYFSSALNVDINLLGAFDVEVYDVNRVC